MPIAVYETCLPNIRIPRKVLKGGSHLCAGGGHGAIRRCPPLKLSAVDDWRAAEHHGRRRADVALPDAAIIELNADAIGRIDSALAARINPDSAVGRVPVGPGLVGLTRFRREVHGFPVLRDEGGSTEHAVPTHMDAPVSSGQVDRCGRGASGGARSQEAQGQR
jgi:hypothetical protein